MLYVFYLKKKKKKSWLSLNSQEFSTNLDLNHSSKKRIDPSKLNK